jgi:hypothetical protein
MRGCLILTLVTSLAACSGPGSQPLAERAAEKAAAKAVSVASGGKVSHEDGAIRVEGEAGQQMQINTNAAGLSLPDWWPADVYLPEQALVQQVVQNEGNHVLAAIVSSPAAQVQAQIAQAMQERGWETRRSAQAAGGAGMTTFARDRQQVMVMVAPARRKEAGVMVTYRLTGLPAP